MMGTGQQWEHGWVPLEEWETAVPAAVGSAGAGWGALLGSHPGWAQQTLPDSQAD